MQNRFRVLALVMMMTLSAAPTLKAETMGTNPKPKSAIAVFQQLVDAAFAYLGL